MQSTTKPVEQSSKRLTHLRNIEQGLQKEWKSNNLFASKHEKDWEKRLSWEDKNKEKFMVTFPYPYMNGRLHLGHAFSLSKCEFQSRYQRLIGKNVSFPFAFHCTGMPIAAAANKVKKEIAENIQDSKDYKTQSSILRQVGVPEEEIKNFADPYYWLDYFPPRGQEDLESFGVNCDFTKSFITTEKQKFYDRFVQWHFLKLKEAGKVKFGKRHTIFSKSDDQPCADHDRSEGEGIGPQEYTLIKLKVIDNIPEKLKKYTENKNVFLVAATLRPETMYGQTNCFVYPSGEYGLYEMANGELFICSEHSAVNMAYQVISDFNF
jgi:leucyl-tRNA synthetase